MENHKVKVVEAPALAQLSDNYGKIVLQPRLCTLRSFAGERGGVLKQAKNQNVDVSRFFETLSDYIESSKKSEDFEIISGRLAMVRIYFNFLTPIFSSLVHFEKFMLWLLIYKAGV